MESIESVRICVCLTGLTMWYSLMSLYTKQLEKRGISTALHRITESQHTRIPKLSHLRTQTLYLVRLKREHFLVAVPYSTESYSLYHSWKRKWLIISNHVLLVLQTCMLTSPRNISHKKTYERSNPSSRLSTGWQFLASHHCLGRDWCF